MMVHVWSDIKTLNRVVIILLGWPLYNIFNQNTALYNLLTAQYIQKLIYLYAHELGLFFI